MTNWVWVKLTKKLWHWTKKLFCWFWAMWWRCVICPQLLTALLAFYINFIFAMVSNLLFPKKKSYHNHLSHLLSCENEAQKTATTAAMATGSAAYCNSYLQLTSHSCGCSFTHGFPPPPATKLASFFLLPEVRGNSQAGCSCNSVALTMQKLKI